MASPSPDPAAASFTTEVILGGLLEPTDASGPNQFATATVACPEGTVALGGGIKATPAPDAAQPSPLHVDGSFPSDAGGHPVADGQTPTHWTAVAEEGTSVSSASVTTTTYAFGLCGFGGIGSLSTSTKVAIVGGPIGASGYATATATCPAGTMLVGGGASTVPGNEGIASQQPSPLHITASAPSDASGRLVTSAGAVAMSWTATAEEGADTSYAGGSTDPLHPAIPTTTAAFAICATGAALHGVEVAVTTVTGPEGAGGPANPQTYATPVARCPAGTVLVGGGSSVQVPGTQTQPSPLHIDGDYPSNGDGTVPTQSESVTYWSTISESGNAMPGDSTSAYAICAS